MKAPSSRSKRRARSTYDTPQQTPVAVRESRGTTDDPVRPDATTSTAEQFARDAARSQRRPPLTRAQQVHAYTGHGVETTQQRGLGPSQELLDGPTRSTFADDAPEEDPPSTEQYEERGWPHALMRVLVTISASFLVAVALEACTMGGSFAHNVADLAQWSLRRLWVFFLLLLVPSWLAVTRIDRAANRQQEAVPVTYPRSRERTAARSLCALVAGIVIGLVLGIPLSFLGGDAGDMRYGVVASCIATAVLLLAANRKMIARSMEWGFLILALCFGSTFCVLMPTSAQISWDGGIHFKNANGLSYLAEAEYTGADQIMTSEGVEGALYLTDNLSFTEKHLVELDSREVEFPHANLEDTNVRVSNEMLADAEEHGKVIQLEDTQAYPYGNFAQVRSLGLIPNACGLWLGRLLHVSCVARYFLARLASVVFYSVVFFFAIRSLRRGKLIMAAIGLCPTSLLMAANFSYDPWTICLVALSFGVFVGTLQDEGPVTLGKTLGMVVPFVLGALVKAVIFPLALLFLLIPRRRFASTQAFVRHVALVVLGVMALLLSFALPFFATVSQGETSGDVRGGADVSTSRQLAYVVAHPLDTLGMGVLFTLRMLNPAVLGFAVTPADENLLYYFPYLIATNAPLNEFVAAAEFLLLVAVGVLDGGQEDEGYRGVRYKLPSLLTCGLSFALIAGALYATFTDVGRDTISGVQYRYLLPLLAPFLLLLPNTQLRRRDNPTWLAPAFAGVEALLLTLVLINSFVVLF